VTGRLDLDPAMPLLTDAPPHARTIVITTSGTDPDLRAAVAEHADVVIAGESSVDLAVAVHALRGRGFSRILTEGGPALLAQLATAGLVDELCLTIGPLLAGPGASRIVTGSPGLAPVLLRLGHVIEADGFLLCRYTTGAGPTALPM